MVQSIFEVVAHDRVVQEYAFDTDILVNGGAELRTSRIVSDGLLDEETRPALALGIRIWFDGVAVRFALAPDRIDLERGNESTRIERTCREVTVQGDSDAIWRLLGLVDGARSTIEILKAFHDAERESIARLLADLAYAGAVDASGRRFGRFLHAVSCVGVLPNGGLSHAAIHALATDRGYRTYPGAARRPVSREVPQDLHALDSLLRRRRSALRFDERPLAAGQLDALLTVACGVTGAMRLDGNLLPLRAYPSAGGLYSIEIYPLVFAADGVDPGIYHYLPNEDALELLAPDVCRTNMLDTALPSQRETLTGAAAMLCLTARFGRFERKYGQGSNRVLAAEAGHLGQNLILAATALGLQARPCGGFFDGMLNGLLGLDEDDEQFLIAVVIGHPV